MRIPSDEAIIPLDKLTRYLLVPLEQDDKSQLLALADFTPDNYRLLETGIRGLLRHNDAVFDHADEYGEFYRVKGSLQGVTTSHCAS